MAKQNRLNKDQKEELFEMYKTYKYTYRELAEKFDNLLQPTKPLIFTKKKCGSEQYGMQISNKRISDKLNELGCIPQKTFTLDIPNTDQVPEHLFSHYMRGFFDGDGWLGKKDISVTSSNIYCKNLSVVLADELGIKTRLRPKGKVTELCFSRHGIEKFLDWIYKDSTIFLERKYQRYIKYHKKLTLS